LELAAVVYLMVIVMLGYLIQSISGFGAIIFSLPLAMYFIDASLFVPVALVFSILQSGYIAFRDWRHIDKKQFLIMILLAGLGAPLGLYLSSSINEQLMNYLLGIFICINSTTQIKKIIKGSKVNQNLKKHTYIYPMMSGLLQAAYGVGGPMIGAYMSKVTDEKKTYRAMLSLYWTILNPFILFGYYVSGILGREHIVLFTRLFPSVVVGLLLGNLVVDKISQKKFSLFVNGMLIIIGVLLFF